MSSKLRNTLAYLLLLLAAFGWVWGRELTVLAEKTTDPTGAETSTVSATVSTEISSSTSLHSTTHPITEASTESTTATTITDVTTTVSTLNSVKQSDAPMSMTEPSLVNSKYAPSTAVTIDLQPQTTHTSRLPSILLTSAAILLSAVAMLVCLQKAPILGLDGMAWLAVIAFLLFSVWRPQEFARTPAELRYYRIGICFATLIMLRELVGWLWAHCRLAWTAAYRTALRRRTPQGKLTIWVVWMTAAVIGFFGVLLLNAYNYHVTILFPAAVLFLAALPAFLCMLRYGAGLSHFEKQLENYRQGVPIAVGNGSFSQTEMRLAQMQTQHEEAVRTAVANERFKVDLIANVSHDLRTPLTAILGYSELLQGETLSPDGQEQLTRLHQKAGYMSELVESLFELTKISSGVVEAKKETIDLIRLLEQTIGLLDDQLSAAGLSVRRNYCAESIPIVTDGNRMHQVFSNLLGNAIKYALGGTRIWLNVCEEAQSFTVRMVNTACYEMDFQPDEITERFSRGDKARSTQGSGLGLAIAQTYTESVGGSFHVAVDGDQFSAIVSLPKN